MIKKELICVNCPMGCHLEAVIDNNTVISVSGNHCVRGKEYALTECIRPERILTTTVLIENAMHRVLPVISEKAIPLDMTMQAMAEIKTISVSAPVREGDIVYENIAGSGVNMIASRSMKAL